MARIAGQIGWPTKLGYIPSGLVIRLLPMGCANRVFYQIGVTKFKWLSGTPAEEVIGNIDTFPNERNELIASCDLKRLVYWLGMGATMSPGVQGVLGLSGFMPIPPHVYIKAFQMRQKKLGKMEFDRKDREPNEPVLPYYTRLY